MVIGGASWEHGRLARLAAQEAALPASADSRRLCLAVSRQAAVGQLPRSSTGSTVRFFLTPGMLAEHILGTVTNVENRHGVVLNGKEDAIHPAASAVEEVADLLPKVSILRRQGTSLGILGEGFD